MELKTVLLVIKMAFKEIRISSLEIITLVKAVSIQSLVTKTNGLVSIISLLEAIINSMEITMD
jgi:hypothetical protein